MALGRNDPCPCGSGKKYKKCCLDADQATARAALAPPPSPVPEPARYIHGDEDEAPDPFWAAFEAQEYEEQIAQFTETLDEGGMDDIELSFGMLELIHAQSVERGHDGRFLPLLDDLRERAPDLYAPDAAYYLEWRIEHALATGQAAILPSFAAELAATAATDIDTFNRIADQLAYHGLLPFLREVLHAAWSSVRDMEDEDVWSNPEFIDRLSPYEIFSLLDEGLSADEAAAALPERMVASYTGLTSEVPAETVELYVGHLAGTAAGSWTRDDFAFLDRKPEGEEGDAQAQLFYLSIAFMGYARREEGVPYSKAFLATGHLREYLLGRREDGLVTQEYGAKVKRPVTEADLFPGLRPESATLDQYFVLLLDPTNMQFHAAAALIELFPAWLRFLETRGLLTEGQQETALAACREVAGNLVQVWDAYPSDPALAAGLRASGLVPLES